MRQGARALAAAVGSAWRRGGPEALLGVLAVAVFLGCLGSLDLWGKREQRAAAEAIDTIEHQHWLVAEIQGRPRLEKPPLPRWTIALLMSWAGTRSEWLVRLPGALCGLATVALIYGLGRRTSGREAGLAAGLVLCSLGTYVFETRQAGNDAPLALFTTLALVAAWRLLEQERIEKDVEENAEDGPKATARNRAARKWALLFYVSLGLGFLSKGPIVLMIAAVTIVPYLAFSGRLAEGVRRLADGRGLSAFFALAAIWPLAVLGHDPNAWRVWMVEMSEKTGAFHVLEHHRHTPLAAQWPALALPWTLVALAAALAPFWKRRGAGDRDGPDGPSEETPGTAISGRNDGSSPIWFAWWWAIGNLGAFSLWAIAKSSYYVPCMPGLALLIGLTWDRLSREARGGGRRAGWARAVLQAHWVMVFCAGTTGPALARPWLAPALWPWTLAIGGALAASAIASACVWRRGGDGRALLPIAAAGAFATLIIYGILAPPENARRGHRHLAESLARLVPPNTAAIHFFNEIDEGLWFYYEGARLLPVPGTRPRYSTAYDLAEAYRARQDASLTLDDLDAQRQARETGALLSWLDRARPNTDYLLIRSKLFERLAPRLAPRTTPVLSETGLHRNPVVLLRVNAAPPAIAAEAPGAPRR